jgi:hypothetical protein
MAQNAEYSFNRLTNMILLHGQAERNSAAAEASTLKGIRKCAIQSAGHSFLGHVVSEKQVARGTV